MSLLTERGFREPFRTSGGKAPKHWSSCRRSPDRMQIPANAYTANSFTLAREASASTNACAPVIVVTQGTLYCSAARRNRLFVVMRCAAQRRVDYQSHFALLDVVGNVRTSFVNFENGGDIQADFTQPARPSLPLPSDQSPDDSAGRAINAA